MEKYAILMETSGGEFESWYYFIRYEGNQEALYCLQEQLSQVRWRILDDYSTFDLELDNLVSETTAKEMTMVDLNPTSRHRKFDGVLQEVRLGFQETDKNSRKIKKAFEVLGYGKIENFIDREDVEDDDLDVEISCESSCCESSSDDDSDDTETESDDEPPKRTKIPEVKVRAPPVISASERARKLRLGKK